jgi:Glycosyltransferase family 87
MSSFAQKRKFFVVAFLLAMTVGNISLIFIMQPKLRNGYQDFTIFYTAARLIREGNISSLYNLSAQYQMEQRFTHVPIRKGPLPYNHPPFEALFFIPFTLLAYWPAYLLWTAINLVMLAASVVLLRRLVPEFASVPLFVLGIGSVAYFPVAIGIMQGQDVILLLLIFVLVMVFLNRRQDVAAGALLGAGLFRPHLIVPLIVLIAVRRWRVLVGFTPVALVLAGITVAMMGWWGPLDYVHFVLRLEATDARAFGPEAVPNLRGLVMNLPWIGASHLWTSLIIFASSLLVFFTALRRILSGRDSVLFSFSLALVATLLISFHALVYDFALLLPIVLFLLSRVATDDGANLDTTSIPLVFLLFLTPLYIFLLMVVDSFVCFSVILLWLYLRLTFAPRLSEMST